MARTTDAEEVEKMIEMSGMTKETEEMPKTKREKVSKPQKEPGSFYCWLINDRTGYKKLVSKDYAFRKTQGFFNMFGIRVKPWKDTYTVKEIKK